MKKWITQKTTLAGLASILTGAGLLIGGNTPEGLQMIGGGLIAIFLRQAIEKKNN